MIIKSLEHLSLVSKQIADKVLKEDCIFLYGEIGTGKTTFSRYFINHLQKKGKIQETEVPSPTFNLLYEYEIKTSKIMHYDLYRLKTSEETKQLGIFEDNKKTIKIIEWPELLKDSVQDKLEINFKYTENENEREINFKGSGKWREFQINEL
jgi:tRNA threonylcarbamoyl adenosine modification protein YjeE